MDSKRLVICDPEEGYASALASYFMRRKELAFQVYICRSLQNVKTMQEEEHIDYLIISADCDSEERGHIAADSKFILTVSGQERLEKDEIPVMKYQPGEAILTEIIRCCGSDGQNGELYFRTAKKVKCTLIGVFSPVHRIGKTSYAIELGQKLALKMDVLYVNMELYGGKGGLFEEDPSYTLADVLYYSRQESKNLPLVLSTMTGRMKNLDYLNPMPVSDDVKEVAPQEWTGLIRQIVENSIYETVILDVDEGLRGVYDILRLCTEVHMPAAEDEVSCAKVRQFEAELQLLGYEDVLQKLNRKEQKG